MTDQPNPYMARSIDEGHRISTVAIDAACERQVRRCRQQAGRQRPTTNGAIAVKRV